MNYRCFGLRIGSSFGLSFALFALNSALGLFFFCAGLGLAQPEAQASNLSDINNSYLILGAVTTEKLAEETLHPSFSRHLLGTVGDCSSPVASDNQGPRNSLRGTRLNGLDPGEIASWLSSIVNMGEKIWGIISANKPVMNAQWASASALPAKAGCWLDLAGWQDPKAITFRTRYKNGFGMTVVDFTYRVIYLYGGSLQGAGKFLANVQVQPAEVNVAWGWQLEAKASVPAVVNVGSTTDPVAGMQVLIDWTVKTVVTHSEQSSAYFVKGDGQLTSF